MSDSEIKSIAQKVHQIIRKVSDDAFLNVSGIGGTLTVSSIAAVINTVAPLLKNKHVYDLGSGAGHAMLTFALGTDVTRVSGCELQGNLHLKKIFSSASCDLAQQYPRKCEVFLSYQLQHN